MELQVQIKILAHREMYMSIFEGSGILKNLYEHFHMLNLRVEVPSGSAMHFKLHIHGKTSRPLHSIHAILLKHGA
jgi:hypothetical protein